MARSTLFGTVTSELALIAAIRRRAPSVRSSALRLGIGDDSAVLRPKTGHEICVTTDFTLEQVHFRRDLHPPESVGHRCLARGLSDLAAMGAEPLAVFLSIALPARLSAAWLERFLDGFLALASKHSVPLAGGDTAQSPSLFKQHDGLIAADIIALGQVPRGKALLRSRARPGDLIYVTGALGGAAAELAALAKNPRKFSKLTDAVPGHPHLYPEPRLPVGRRLRGLANAMIDVSDGLSSDLTHLCEESRVSAMIEEAALPIHPLAAKSPDSLNFALHGGEDYELLFTAPPATRIPRGLAGVPIHRIGKILTHNRGKATILLKTPNARPVPVTPEGWEHFR